MVKNGDNNFRGHAAMFAAYVIFGLNTPVSKAIMAGSGVSAFALTFYRMAGAAALFWFASLFAHREKIPAKDILLLFFASLLGIQINQMCFIVGLSLTSPIDASVITTLVPILTMVMAAIFLREPITWKKVAGVLLGASGAVILIFSNRHLGRGGSSTMGNLLCVASCASFALYLSLFRGLISRYKPVTLMKWMFLFAAVCCLPLCWRDVSAVDYGGLPWDIYLRIGYVVVAATFISYFLIPVGQKRLRPTVVSMYNYLQPLVSTLVAVAVGMGVFGWTKAGATLLIFIGVYVVTRSKSRAQLDAERTGKN